MNKPVIEADNGERQRALSPATCCACAKWYLWHKGNIAGIYASQDAAIEAMNIRAKEGGIWMVRKSQ